MYTGIQFGFFLFTDIYGIWKKKACNTSCSSNFAVVENLNVD